MILQYHSIETLGKAILNLSGQIDLPITPETSHYLCNIIMSEKTILSVKLLSVKRKILHTCTSTNIAAD